MTDVVALSDLSDEPIDWAPSGRRGHWRCVSPRLAAVLDRLPVRNKTGTDTRIGGLLFGYSLTTLLSKSRMDLHTTRGWGEQMIADIEEALAHFHLYLRDVQPAVVVGDNATSADAHVQRLQKWITERFDKCDEHEKRVGSAAAAHEITEREVLADVMLILDGREPTNRRRVAEHRLNDDSDASALRRVTGRANLLSSSSNHVLFLDCRHQVRYLSRGEVPDYLGCPLCLGRPVPKVQTYP